MPKCGNLLDRSRGHEIACASNLSEGLWGLPRWGLSQLGVVDWSGGGVVHQLDEHGYRRFCKGSYRALILKYGCPCVGGVIC